MADPAFTPVTVPLPSTVATEVSLEVQISSLLVVFSGVKITSHFVASPTLIVCRGSFAAMLRHLTSVLTVTEHEIPL